MANQNLKIKKIKQKILPILQRYGARRAALFGSCVRCEMKKVATSTY